MRSKLEAPAQELSVATIKILPRGLSAHKNAY